MQHRSPGTKSDIHLDGDTQLALKGVTDARAQVRLREIHHAFLQSGPQANGAENELAGLPAILTKRRRSGMRNTDQVSGTVLCYLGVRRVRTDIGVTSLEIDRGSTDPLRNQKA